MLLQRVAALALVLLVLVPQIALASPFSTVSGALSGTWDFLAKQRDISNVPFLSDALRFIGGNSWGNGFLSIVLGINVDSATGRITTSIGDMALNALIVVGGVGAIAKVAGIGVRGGVVATRGITTTLRAGEMAGRGGGVVSKLKNVVHLTGHVDHYGRVPHFHLNAAKLGENNLRKLVKPLLNISNNTGSKIVKAVSGKVKHIENVLINRPSSIPLAVRQVAVGAAKVGGKVLNGVINGAKAIGVGLAKYTATVVAHPFNPIMGRAVYNTVAKVNSSIAKSTTVKTTSVKSNTSVKSSTSAKSSAPAKSSPSKSSAGSKGGGSKGGRR